MDAFTELASLRIRVDGYDDWILPERLISPGLLLVTEYSDNFNLLPELLAGKKKKSTADDEESR